jgi:putative MATE family efflux protein
MTGLGLLIVEPMLRMMGTPADVMDEARAYLTIYFAGIGGLLLYNMCAAILQAVGDARRPLYFLCFSALVNTVLDLLFVIAFGMGVEGVAYATIIAQFLSAALVLWVLSHDHAPYGIRWNRLRISPEMLRRIVRIGLPAALQQTITSFSNVFVQGYINAFGSACMAGWSSYGKLDSFILIPVQSIAMASTTFVGQNYGACDLPRARRGVSSALQLSLGITAVISVLVMALARPLMALFTTDPEVLDYGVHFILIVSPFYLLLCFNQVFAGALRGVGIARAPMVVMIGSFVVFRQLYLFANSLLGNSFLAVTLAYPVGWALCSALLTVLYLRSALGKAKAPPSCEVEPETEKP